VDVECTGAGEERVDDANQVITAPPVPSRQEPTKLDYVRRLSRVQRDQYAPLCGKELGMRVEHEQTTSEGSPPTTQPAGLRLHHAIVNTSLDTSSSSMKRSSLLSTDTDGSPSKRPCRTRRETQKAREAREEREEAAARRRGSKERKLRMKIVKQA
jgi:hypothetical protein